MNTKKVVEGLQKRTLGKGIICVVKLVWNGLSSLWKNQNLVSSPLKWQSVVLLVFFS